MSTPPESNMSAPEGARPLSDAERVLMAEGRRLLRQRRTEHPEAAWVRQAVRPFGQRHRAVLALIILLGVGVLADVVLRPGWILLVDVAVVASAVTLFRALQGFEAARRSGHPSDMQEGLVQLMKHVRLNVVLGWVGVLVGGVLLVVFVGLLLMGATALSGAIR